MLARRRLDKILNVAENIRSTRVIICGIPDVGRMHRKTSDAAMVDNFKRALDRFATISGEVIVMPFYPAGTMHWSEWPLVEELNERIRAINRRRGEVTPYFLDQVFSPQGRNCSLTGSLLQEDQVNRCRLLVNNMCWTLAR